MPSLFVIGNGFDLAHHMKTGFNQFRNYLITNYSIEYNNALYVPESILDNHGEEVQNPTEVVALITNLLDSAAEDTENGWNKIEDLLGELNLPECFDCVEPQYDKDGDRNYFWEYENAESICRNMALAIPCISELLSEWIHTIEIPTSPITRFSEMINPSKDLFFTFNYTQTLEKLYGCTKENVCHIHGIASDDSYFQVDKLILGHCGQIDYLNSTGVPYEMEYGLQAIYENLRKNTSEQIVLHEDFFKKINSAAVDKIYSFGFSFADVDLQNKRKICNSIDTKNITWWLNAYGGIQEYEKQMKILKSCGFQGVFRTYSMD